MRPQKSVSLQRSVRPILVFILLAAGIGAFSLVADAARPQAGPIAAAIIPATAANNAGTPATILGSGFTTQTTATLGTTILTTVYVSPTQLATTVPWGLEPGTYTLTLAEPGQPASVLTGAFTVTLGVGRWINNGPFGGQINDLVVRPGAPPRLYAAVHNAGVFMSTDGGATWTMLINDSFPMRIQIAPADPQVLYVNTNRSIRRSLDGGASWTSLEPDEATPGGTLAAFPHPSEPGTVFIAASPNMNNYNEGGNGGLWKSTDHGDTLQTLANAGLSDKRITELAFDPRDATHQTMVAGTIAGTIFLTTNGGASWTQTADLARPGDQQPARVDRLVYNPTGDREPWAVKRNPFLPTDWPVLYRSNSNLSAWTGVMVVDDPAGGPHPWFWMRPSSLMFTAGRIWAAYDTGYTSPNGANLDWSRLNPAGIPDETWRDFQFTIFAVDPANPNLVYGGAQDHGVYKSADGGQTWTEANQGLAGVNPFALAVAPDNLDEVYAVSQAGGLAKSSDGGRHWSLAGFQRGGFPWQQTSLVVDVHDPRVVYLGQWCATNQASAACVRISRDRGQTWSDVMLPQPPPGNFEHGEVFAVAVDPQRPGRVLAGATFYPFNWSQNVEHPFGAFYASDDYGRTWSRANLAAAQVKGSYVIAFDGGQPGVAYAGTDGAGLWKTTDGGVTWERRSWTNCADTGEPDTKVSVHAVATRPGTAQEVYASCEVKAGQQLRSAGLFRSTDAGLTWQAVKMPPRGAESLLFLPSPAGLVLYAGGWGGAASSLDGGMTWSPIDGVPAGAAYALAGMADEERAVLYISTEAGMGTPGAEASSAADTRMMPGGAYGLTQRLPNSGVYLPVILRE